MHDEGVISKLAHHGTLASGVDGIRVAEAVALDIVGTDVVENGFK